MYTLGKEDYSSSSWAFVPDVGDPDRVPGSLFQPDPALFVVASRWKSSLSVSLSNKMKQNYILKYIFKNDGCLVFVTIRVTAQEKQMVRIGYTLVPSSHLPHPYHRSQNTRYGYLLFLVLIVEYFSGWRNKTSATWTNSEGFHPTRVTFVASTGVSARQVWLMVFSSLHTQFWVIRTQSSQLQP